MLTRTIKVVVLFAILVTPALAAIYRGENIDGKKYQGVAKDYTGIYPVLVEFDGQFVYIKFDDRVQALKLLSEAIDDARDIEAVDSGGSRWLLDVAL